ncbi:MAG: DUF1801 domain-containing protein [Balneola sp.]
MRPQLLDFYSSKKEPIQSCLFALRDIILEFSPEITETLKYGMPCFVYRKKHFCYLWTDKKSGYPYILIVEGNKIHHPSLRQGDRKRMKEFLVKPNEDIPVAAIHEVLNLALTHYI